MYLWLIIATFMAALAVMGTSLRTDIRRIYVEPQAQNVVTKIYTQHRAAMKYVFNNRRSGDGNSVGYHPGEISAADLKGYVPYGFNADSGTATFTTALYCLDKDSPGHSDVPADCKAPEDDGSGTTPSAPVVNCCAAKGRIVYLITYGCVPYKWRDIYSNKPSSDLLGAMKDTLGYVNGFGYVVDKEKDSPDMGKDDKYDTLKTRFGISGQGSRPYYSIPTGIGERTLSELGSKSFSHVCGSGRSQGVLGEDDESDDNYYKSCDYCLVYMSTF